MIIDWIYLYDYMNNYLSIMYEICKCLINCIIILNEYVLNMYFVWIFLYEYMIIKMILINMFWYEWLYIEGWYVNESVTWLFHWIIIDDNKIDWILYMMIFNMIILNVMNDTIYNCYMRKSIYL